MTGLFSLDEEQRALQETVRRIARDKVAPRAAEIDATAEYPQDMFDLLREMGLFALPFPQEYGGTGSILSSCVVVEELARVCYNTAYLLLIQWVPFGAILKAGNDEQKGRFLAGLASGELRGALGVTEPAAGSDVGGIQTRARREGDTYRLDGTKIFCTNAAVADFVLVAARSAPGKGPGGISLFIVEKGTPGFTVVRNESKMGGRGVPSSELAFEDCAVPLENRVGSEHDGFKPVMETFNRTRPVIGARGVGLAQGALDLAVEYMREREAFGRKIGAFQGLRWMIADMAMATESARQMVYKAAATVDAHGTGKEVAGICAMAKCLATDTAMKVAVDAVQVFGAVGVSKDFPIERYMRDAKLLQIVEGTNQIQRNIVADAVIGRFPS